jgi:hypothetical protein
MKDLHEKHFPAKI